MYGLVLILLEALYLQKYLVSPAETTSGRSYANPLGTSSYVNNNYVPDVNSVNYDDSNYANHKYVNDNNHASNNNKEDNIYTSNSYSKDTSQANRYGNGNEYIENGYNNEKSVSTQTINENYGNSNNNYALTSQIQEADNTAYNPASNQNTQTFGSGIPNTGYGQTNRYFRFPTGYAQERFHPHGHIHSHDDDSHTGEVVLPPLQPAASQNFVNVVNPQGSQNTFLDTASSLSNFQTDSFAQASDAANVQEEPPLADSIESDDTPPALPNGYDYHPQPPPLPPPPPVPAATPYYQYPPPAPPSNQYLPAPTQPPPPPVPAAAPYYYYPPPAPPSHQYLPAPTQPPPPSNQYLPAPTLPPPPSNHYLPVEIHHPESAPEEERQVDYTYYYLGPKLWYVPLFFSIYFVLYVGALIIKAVSKHKILFPQQLYNAASSVYQGRGDAAGASSLDLLTDRVTRALATQAFKYFRSRSHGND